MKLDYDFEKSVGCWVVTAARTLERALNEELAPHGITYRQCQVIGTLVMEQDLTQAQLARRLGVEAPTLAGVLDRMERDGWLTREPCPTDRRCNLLVLAPTVEPVWNRIVACAHRVRARATEGLDDADLARLKSLLERVRTNLETEEAKS